MNTAIITLGVLVTLIGAQHSLGVSRYTKQCGFTESCMVLTGVSGCYCLLLLGDTDTSQSIATNLHGTIPPGPTGIPKLIRSARLPLTGVTDLGH